jgi:hypothetical protein
VTEQRARPVDCGCRQTGWLTVGVLPPRRHSGEPFGLVLGDPARRDLGERSLGPKLGFEVAEPVPIKGER